MMGEGTGDLHPGQAYTGAHERSRDTSEGHPQPCAHRSGPLPDLALMPEAASPQPTVPHPTLQTNKSLFEAIILQQLLVETGWRVLETERGRYLFVLCALS